MRNTTRQQYNAMLEAMAKTYGVPSTQQKFAIEEPIATRLNDAIQDSDSFLSMINVLPVVDMKGQGLNMTIQTTLAGRTDTAGGTRRSPQLATGPAGLTYECKQTNFDVAMPYNVMDTWARFPDFSKRYMNAVYRRMALDRIMIGWYGTTAADSTDRDTYATLSDVNTGWLKLLSTNVPENFLLEGVEGSGEITLGASCDFANLDSLVYSIFSMIEKKHRTGNEIAIIGQELITNDMGKILETHAQTPTEKNAIRALDKSYGGLPSIMVPQFPERGVLVTDPKNLHLYYQASAMRRLTKDEPEYDRVADYISSNDAYFFGNFEGAAALDHLAVVFADEIEEEAPAEG